VNHSLALGDGVATGLLVVLAVIVVVGLVAVAAAVYVIVRYRPPIRGTAALIGSLVYLLSPVDAVPEAVLGPAGLLDDLTIVIAAVLYVRRLLAERDEAASLPPPPFSAREALGASRRLARRRGLPRG